MLAHGLTFNTYIIANKTGLETAGVSYVIGLSTDKVC